MKVPCACPEEIDFECFNLCRAGELCGAWMLILQAIAFASGHLPDQIGPGGLVHILPIEGAPRSPHAGHSEELR